MSRTKTNYTRSTLQTISLFASLCIFATPTHALKQNEMLWLAANVERPLTADRQWEYLVYTQTSLENESQPWNRTLFEVGMGRHLDSNKQAWFGYRWSAHHPNNGYYQENRLWQQFLWSPIATDDYKIFTRSRLEEIERGNQAQMAVRLRQRFSYLVLHEPIHNIRPLIYDEIFMQPKTANWTASEFFSSNRLFLGFRWQTSKAVFWEIGYMNQFIRGIGSNQNSMNHIVTMTYNDV